MNLVLFMDTSLEEMSRSGQLPRLIFYLEAYSAQFNKVYVITRDDYEMQERLPPRCLCLRTGDLPAGRFLHPFIVPFLFRRELGESDVYRVLGLFLPSMIPSMIASILYAKPVVATYQYRYSEFARVEGRSPLIILLTRLKEKIGLLLAARVIVTTRDLEEHIKKQMPEKDVWLIPNGVVLDFFTKPKRRRRPAKGSSRNVLFVGRLTKQKNLFSLLKAMRLIEGVKLTIVGEGPLQGELTNYSRELGLDVRFQGYVPHDQLVQFYSAADVFVIPSLIEGHPKVLLEAMACGLPVVGTDVEGIRGIIAHEQNGLLCGADPESIGNAVRRLLEDRRYAGKLGKNARGLIIKKYDLRSILSRETALMVDLARSERDDR